MDMPNRIGKLRIVGSGMVVKTHLVKFNRMNGSSIGSSVVSSVVSFVVSSVVSSIVTVVEEELSSVPFSFQFNGVFYDRLFALIFLEVFKPR